MWPLLAAGAVAAYGAYAAAWPSASRWGRSIDRLPTRARRIALTFDDGPSNETPRFLDLLSELDVRATFFVCGQNVERLPDVARAIVDADHEIANHSYSHPILLVQPARRVRSELTRTQLVIEDATGVSPSLFRAPYGLRSPSLSAVQRDLNLLAIIGRLSGTTGNGHLPELSSAFSQPPAPGASFACTTDTKRAKPPTAQRR